MQDHGHTAPRDFYEHHSMDASAIGNLAYLPGYTAQPYSGEWRYLNGEMICDGYLTRREDKEFCEPNVPDDWRAFRYDGEIYYVQPLSASIVER